MRDEVFVRSCEYHDMAAGRTGGRKRKREEGVAGSFGNASGAP